MSDSEEDVPPLEDFTEHFAKVELERQQQQGGEKKESSEKEASAGHPEARPVISEVRDNGLVRGGPATSDNADAKPATAVLERSTTDRAKPPTEGSTQSLNGSSKPRRATTKPATSKPSSSGFAGFSKGFLSGGSSSAKKPTTTRSTKPSNTSHQPTTSSNRTPDDNMPFISASGKNGSAKSDLTFPEVQEALKASQPLLSNTQEWLTPDLQHAMATNKVLGPRLADPRFSSLLEEFQKNPQETLTKHQGSEEMRSFLQEFCSVMGEHFTRLGEAQEAASPAQSAAQTDSLRPLETIRARSAAAGGLSEADQQQMEAILRKPDVQTALRNPEIQQIIELARSNPDEASRRMRSGSREVQAHVKTLVSVGLLAFA